MQNLSQVVLCLIKLKVFDSFKADVEQITLLASKNSALKNSECCHASVCNATGEKMSGICAIAHSFT